MPFTRLLREPFLHFVVFGAALFGVDWALGGAPDVARADRIVVDAGEVERLTAHWHALHQRAPDPDELEDLIDGYVREEVLYREAVALGLDRDDTIVRRRLVQKLEFLTQDIAATREPTEAELATYFAEHEDRYRASSRITFHHIYFDPARRGAGLEHEAAVVLASLRTGDAQLDAAELGDRIMLDPAYRAMTTQDVAAVFGTAFADALAGLEVGVWSGPIASGYGVHLVRIDDVVAGDLPALATIVDRVRADWAFDLRQRMNEEVYERLLARYTVVIEGVP